MDILNRVAVLDRTRAAAGELRATLSSEAPVNRGSHIEILNHGPESVDLGRAGNGLPLLASHAQNELPPPGRVESIRLAGRKLRGVLRFSGSARGTELRAAVEEGFIGGLSVGYLVHETRRDGTDAATGLPIVRAMRWELLEVSLVNVPADTAAGVGRALPEVKTQRRIEVMESNENLDAQDRPGRQRYANILNQARQLLEIQTDACPDVAAQLSREFNRELNEILPDDRVAPDQAMTRLRKAMQPILRERGHNIPGQPSSEQCDDIFHGRGAGGGGFGLDARDRSRYSVVRAIQVATEVASGRRRSFDGFEGEIHQELCRTRAAGSNDRGGMLLPWSLGTRTLGTMQPAGGATAVGQMVMPDMIDVLRNQCLVLVSGARLFPGLQGSVIFNKATADPTCYWMAENPAADAAQSEPVYGYVTMLPKTIIGQVQIPRQLLTMASFDLEADIRQRLGTAHALMLDRAALHGAGTDREPIGLYTAAGVQSWPVGGVPDLTDITTMPGKVADANADLGSLGYMTTPLMGELLTRTPLVTGFPQFIWEGPLRNGVIRGYPARASNQVSKTLGAGLNEHGLIFGNWNDLAVGMWGNELEIVVDQATKAARGQILITSYSMCDIAVLRPESFCKGTGALIA